MSLPEKHWVVRLCLECGAMQDERALADLERLRERGAEVTRNSVIGSWEVTISLQASTNEEAAAAASSLVGEVAVGTILDVVMQRSGASRAHAGDQFKLAD